MTDKAYIVANEEQELDILKKFEQSGLVWRSGKKPTDWITSENGLFNSSLGFPYALIERKNISCSSIKRLTDEAIVYDGRKKEKMDNKYKVMKEFMNELIGWRDDNNLDAKNGSPYAFLCGRNIQNIPDVIDIWLTDPDIPIENNKRLIAIVQWLNGEDVFEVENQHKFVVRSENVDDGGNYGYVAAGQSGISYNRYYVNEATKFNTRAAAQEWANSHQVVVEIGADGNEVE